MTMVCYFANVRTYPAAFFLFIFFEKLLYFSHFFSDFQTDFTHIFEMTQRLSKEKNISEKKMFRPPR